MNQSSFFIEKKALFGGYPNHKQLIELKEEGVVWFVDLTHKYEKNIKRYSHLVNNWVNYPIKDGHIPEDKKKFTIFLFIIQMILESLKPGEKLYLHCRGGHGRSSMVIACFLGILLNIPPDESLNLVNEYHALRPNLSSKWLTRRPLSLKQQKFVEGFFGSLYLYSNFQNPYDHGHQSQQQLPLGQIDFRSMVILNFFLHQHPTILEVILNSGFKKIQGEGMTSIMLQELRFYILYFQAKKIFDLT
jgi:hypothetical protein